MNFQRTNSLWIYNVSRRVRPTFAFEIQNHRFSMF